MQQSPTQRYQVETTRGFLPRSAEPVPHPLPRREQTPVAPTPSADPFRKVLRRSFAIASHLQDSNPESAGLEPGIGRCESTLPGPFFPGVCCESLYGQAAGFVFSRSKPGEVMPQVPTAGQSRSTPRNKKSNQLYWRVLVECFDTKHNHAPGLCQLTTRDESDVCSICPF